MQIRFPYRKQELPPSCIRSTNWRGEQKQLESCAIDSESLVREVSLTLYLLGLSGPRIFCRKAGSSFVE